MNVNVNPDPSSSKAPTRGLKKILFFCSLILLLSFGSYSYYFRIHKTQQSDKEVNSDNVGKSVTAKIYSETPITSWRLINTSKSPDFPTGIVYSEKFKTQVVR